MTRIEQAQRQQAQRERRIAERAARVCHSPREVKPVETVSKPVTVTDYFGPTHTMVISLPGLRFLEKQP